MGNPTFSGAVSSVSSFTLAAVLAHAYPYLSKTCQIGVPAFRARVTILDQACTYPTHAILAVNPFNQNNAPHILSFPFKYVNMARLSWWNVVNTKTRVLQICLPLATSRYFYLGSWIVTHPKNTKPVTLRSSVHHATFFTVLSPYLPSSFSGPTILPSSHIYHLESISAKNLDAYFQVLPH